jgi:nucleoid-associated protein YgaU
MAMREHDSLEPYEPSDDPGYDWDYEPEDHGRNVPNILWGRVAVLGAVLLLAFLFGRMTAGGDGVPQERLTAAQGDLREAQATITTLEGDVQDLEKQLAAAQNNTDPGADTESDDDGEGGGEETEDPLAGGEKYIVKSGDTLNQIAEKFYGDASKADFIQTANGIVDPTAISPGDEIVIPVEPE